VDRFTEYTEKSMCGLKKTKLYYRLTLLKIRTSDGGPPYEILTMQGGSFLNLWHYYYQFLKYDAR
jgi:hypothetical protein